MQAPYNPDAPGQLNNRIFGLPFSCEEASLVLIPVPWEVTTSYKRGTANGPDAILNASPQLDLYDITFGPVWKKGIALEKKNVSWIKLNNKLSKKSKKVIDFLEKGGDAKNSKVIQALLKEINASCDDLNKQIKKQCLSWLNKNKKVGIIGGEHSVPLGFLQALSEKHTSFGILQIDAHADLRQGYEGFVFSHASIMYNAIQIPNVHKLVQVGIRDICQEEINRINDSKNRIKLFSDTELKSRSYKGETWDFICDDIIASLPQKVYISFDIDGLNPVYCPGTGTPVPGGLEIQEAFYLVEKLAESGREIIGFDLCEVSPGKDDWDGNVGARVVYKLAGAIVGR